MADKSVRVIQGNIKAKKIKNKLLPCKLIYDAIIRVGIATFFSRNRELISVLLVV